MKKIYEKLLSITKKKEVFISFAILILVLLAFPVPTFAFWEKIVAAITYLPVAAIAMILMAVILITGGWVFLMTGLLEWIVSPDFIRFSYTKACTSLPVPPGSDCNPIITIGLQATQQFVSMILVILLVYIAISMALRLNEGKAGKLFWKLIIVALLVNFAPVLIGLIVDAANILMNYFLSPLQGGMGQVGNQLSVYWDSITKQLSKLFTDLPGQAGLLAQAMTIIAMNVMVGVTLFLFAALFLVRYVAIWIIVILSPLAFVFWILPEKNMLAKFTKQWWSQLIQWSFVGIPIAFFMFLGISSFSVLSAEFNAAQIQASSTTDPLMVRLMADLFPYFIVMIFLLIGLFIGITSAQMVGAAVVVGAAGYVATKGAQRIRQDIQRRAQHSRQAYDRTVQSGGTRMQAFRSGAAATVGWAWGKQRRAGAAYQTARTTGRNRLQAAWAGATAAYGLNNAINTQVANAAYRNARRRGMTRPQALAYARRRGSAGARSRGARTRRTTIAVGRGMGNALLWGIRKSYQHLTPKKKKGRKEKDK